MIEPISQTTTRDDDFLYMQIADRLSSQIYKRVLKTGE
jgi:hypothetical protein